MASYTTSSNFMTGVYPAYPNSNAGKRGDMSAVSITSIATVLTPTTGKKFRLLGGYFSVSADASVLFEDNASGTTIFRSPVILAKTPFYFDLGTGYLSTAVNNVLKATASASGSITGTLFYSEE